jgi:hypothetical protein
MQGIGALMAAVVSWIALELLSANLNLTWRLCIAFGAVPGLLTFYFRCVSVPSLQHHAHTNDTRARSTTR